MSGPSGFDVSGIEQEIAGEDAGQLVHVQGKDGEPLYHGEGDARRPVTVRIAGTYSKLFRTIEAAILQRNIKLMRRGNAQLTPEQADRNRVELVAGCILSWEGFSNKGQPFPFTKENATKLVAASPWLRIQLEGAQHDHEGFSSPPSGS